MVVELKDPKQIDTLEVRIGDDSYMIPLGTSMTVKEIKALRSNDDVFAFFGKYIPKKVLENLTLDNLTQILKAWNDETERVSGVSLGES